GAVGPLAILRVDEPGDRRLAPGRFWVAPHANPPDTSGEQEAGGSRQHPAEKATVAGGASPSLERLFDPLDDAPRGPQGACLEVEIDMEVSVAGEVGTEVRIGAQALLQLPGLRLVEAPVQVAIDQALQPLRYLFVFVHRIHPGRASQTSVRSMQLYSA